MSTRREIFLQILSKEDLMPPEKYFGEHGLTTEGIGVIESKVRDCWEVAAVVVATATELAKAEKK